jgi:hypothetical protein
MSNNKKVDQEERNRQISEREELENMLKASSDNLESLTEEAKKLSPRHKPISLDYQGIMATSQSEAEDIVAANAMFYLNGDIIETEEYIQQKMRADVVTMSDLLRQSKVAEYAIIKMLEQIEEGDMHPRQFEVLAGFQRSKLELTKSIANYVVVMENNYKAIKEDHRVKREENTHDIEAEVEEKDGDIARGTRGLMETIRGELDRKEKEANAQKLKDAIRNQGIDAEDAILENE